MKIQIIEVDKSVFLFVAVNSSGEILGKCSLKFRKNNIIRFQDDYSDENLSKKEVLKELFTYRLKYVSINFPNHELEAFCDESSKDLFLDSGFEVKEKLFVVNKKSNLFKSHQELTELLDKEVTDLFDSIGVNDSYDRGLTIN